MADEVRSVPSSQPGSGKVVKVSIEAEAKIEASLRYSDPVAQKAFIQGYVRAATLHKRLRSDLAAYRNQQPAFSCASCGHQWSEDAIWCPKCKVGYRNPPPAGGVE